MARVQLELYEALGVPPDPVMEPPSLAQQHPAAISSHNLQCCELVHQVCCFITPIKDNTDIYIYIYLSIYLSTLNPSWNWSYVHQSVCITYIYSKPKWNWGYVHQSVCITYIYSKPKWNWSYVHQSVSIAYIYKKNTQVKLGLCSPISLYNIYLQKIPKWNWSYVHQSVSIAYIYKKIPKWNWSYVHQSVSITYIYKKYPSEIGAMFTN